MQHFLDVRPRLSCQFHEPNTQPGPQSWPIIRAPRREPLRPIRLETSLNTLGTAEV